MSFITLLQAGGSNLVNSKLAAKKLEGLFGKRFCKDICNLMRRGNIASYEGTNGYFFSYKVVVNLNVFGSGMKNRIDSHVESTFVITKELGGGGKRDTNVAYEVCDPNQFCCSTGHSSIFGLRA